MLSTHFLFLYPSMNTTKHLNGWFANLASLPSTIASHLPIIKPFSTHFNCCNSRPPQANYKPPAILHPLLMIKFSRVRNSFPIASDSQKPNDPVLPSLLSHTPYLLLYLSILALFSLLLTSCSDQQIAAYHLKNQQDT